MSNLSSSSRVVAAQEDPGKATIGALVGYARIAQPRRPQPTPWPEKKGRDRKRAWQIKVTGAGLEGFVDWVSILANESTEEEEMSTLTIGFAAREGAPSNDSAPQEEGIPVGGPSVDEIGEGSPSGVATAPLPPPKSASAVPSRRRLPDQVLLSTYVPPHERIAPPGGTVALDLEGALEIIHRYSSFNQAERPVVHMRNLYPNNFRILVAPLIEHYFIPFPTYLSKEAFQSVAEDGMFIRNHDFYRSVEQLRDALLGCYLCAAISL